MPLTSLPIATIVHQIQEFEEQLQQILPDHNDLEMSWKSLGEKNDSVYIHRDRLKWNENTILKLRDFTRHFTGNLSPANFKQQIAAPLLNEILRDRCPQNYWYNAHGVGGETGWNILLNDVDTYLVNDDINSYQERMFHLYRTGCLDRLDKNSNIVEIGGGYGALAKCVLTSHKSCNYYIVDLPTSLKFAASWLMLNGRSCMFVTKEEDLLAEGIDVFLIEQSLLTLLSTVNFDLAINTLSFTEMPRTVVERYAKFLKSRLLLRNGILFEQNNEYYEIENYHALPSTIDILPNYFKFQERVSVCSTLGKVRLWANDEKPSIQHTASQRYSAQQYSIALFGASNLGKTISSEFYNFEDIFCFYDNDTKKWGTEVNNIVVHSPSMIKQHITDCNEKNKPLVIVITNRFIHEIYEQLKPLPCLVTFINDLECMDN